MKKWILIVAAFIAASCNSKQPAKPKYVSPAYAKDSAKTKYSVKLVDNKIDLSCGMPLTAGIEDTCHYKGKVYGFCSKECKDEFMKNPAGAIKEK